MGEELYDLPEGWMWVTVEQISTKVTDGVHQTPNYVNDGIPFISVNNLSDRGTINFKQCKYITIEEHQELFKRCNPEIGDILLSKVGTVGLTAVINTKKDFSLFVNTALIKPVYDLASAKFFSFALRYGFWSSFYNSYISGSTQKFIGTKNISLLPVPLPPLDEQHRIVVKIEELFTQLDAGVELLKKVKAKLKRYRQAVLKAAVEGNLTKEWREANQGELEPASVLLDRILKQRREKWETEQLAKMKAQGKTPKDDSWKLKYKEAIAPDTSDLRELPDEWVWTTLELVANAVDPQPSHRTPPTVDGGVPYIGMGDIKDGKIDFENSRKVSIEVLKEHQERYQLQMGDFIFGKIGTLGKPVKISQPFNYTLSANVVLVQPDINFLNPEFAITYMASPLIETLLKKESRATTQSAFGIQKVRIIPFPLPPSQEQLAIAEEIELIFSVTDKLENTINVNLKRAEKLRQTILKQAFEGKLVPQDPNDEPAEKLLERIKAEKAQREADKKPKRQSTIKSKQPRKSKTTATQLELKLDD